MKGSLRPGNILTTLIITVVVMAAINRIAPLRSFVYGNPA